jgi:hypothetical protein
VVAGRTLGIGCGERIVVAEGEQLVDERPRIRVEVEMFELVLGARQLSAFGRNTGVRKTTGRRQKSPTEAVLVGTSRLRIVRLRIVLLRS